MDRNYARQEAKATKTVAPLAGSVDRNIYRQMVALCRIVVAPLAGSVDRNHLTLTYEKPFLVAPLAGSVDRNQQLQVQAMAGNGRSPRGERG